jgi:hypothetical protein
MSRRHKHIKPEPTIGKKAQERERRQRQAQQRMRLHTFSALALMVLTKWQDNAILLDDIKHLPANERRYIPMQVARCKRSVETVVRMLNRTDGWAAPNSAFFNDASDKIQTLLTSVCNVLPETCRGIDIHSVMTYLIYAALYEWQAMVMDDRKEVQQMISALGAFADHLIKNDSPLLTPMNIVFWNTRSYLHSGALLPIWDFGKCPPGSAEWERRHKQAA